MSVSTTKFIVVILSSISISAPITIFALCTPALSILGRERSVTDISTKLMPCGHFAAKYWSLDVGKQDGSYTYSMQNTRTGTKIDLIGGRLIRANGKHYYKWNNRGTIYQVIWQPSDSEYARVQAFEGGRQVFNKLLKLDYSPCD